MDGVLADFHKEYTKYDPDKSDRKKFRESVLQHNIFEKLDFMPDAQELLTHVSKLNDVDIEILTSMGTHEPIQGGAARTQKQKWLAVNNIPYKANFVREKKEKAKYATPTSILIDDSIGCITPFNAAGGYGILHSKSFDTIRTLDTIILQIKSLNV